MKKLLIASFLVCFALTSFGQITGSAHDFSSNGWSGGEICIACHTPHHADIVNVTNAPLWNHELSIAVYNLYDSPTFDGAGDITQPTESSKLCLACHDGSIALDNFGGTTTGTNYISTPNRVGFGGELADHHPVSFPYTTATATTDGGLWDPVTTSSGLTGTITTDMLFSDQMQCASCHDVHDAAGNASLLLVSNASSALCLTCHNK